MLARAGDGDGLRRDCRRFLRIRPGGDKARDLVIEEVLLLFHGAVTGAYVWVVPGLGAVGNHLQESVGAAHVYILPLPVIIDELKLRLPVLGQLVPGVASVSSSVRSRSCGVGSASG